MPLKLKDRLSSWKGRFFLHDNMPGPFHETESIFVHIPKAAGSSVSMSLYGIQVGHRTFKDYTFCSAKKAESYRSFAVCRDPLQRAFSAFEYIKRGGITEYDRRICYKYDLSTMDFNSFVLDKLYVMCRAGVLHFLPQHHFVERYANGPIGVKRIFHLESLSDDFSEIYDYVRRKDESGQIRKLNKGMATDRDFPKDVRDEIRKVYERDYWVFGYSL